MIKIFIVDDEPIIRQGLRTTIKWSKYDIEVVGEASNGADAYKKIIELSPDIVLTDIRMPLLDGIELIRLLREIALPVKIVILTAYEEISYYSKAIELGVHNFILKNACSDEILSTVLKVRDQVIKEKNQQQEYTQEKGLLLDNLYLIQTNYIKSILSGQESADQLVEKSAQLRLPLNGPSYALIMFFLNTSSDWWTVINLSKEMLSSLNPFIFLYKESLFTAVLNLPNKNFNDHIFNEFLDSMRNYLTDSTPVMMYPLESYKDLEGKGNLLIEALERSCWGHNTDFIHLDKTYLPEKLPLSKFFEYEYDIVNIVNTRKNPIETCNAIDRWYNLLKAHHAPLNFLIESAQRLCVAICSAYQKSENMANLTENIKKCTTAEKIHNVLFDIFSDYKDKTDTRALIDPVIDYIRANYNKNISLSDAAKTVFISPAYLRRILKKETGYSFSEWINKYRIEKAKELLLNTELKHYEISDIVGYSDYKHFSVHFRDLCGCSAKEYRIRNCDKKGNSPSP